jgi:hypothetical protein
VSPESRVLDTFLGRVATRLAIVRALEGMLVGVIAELLVVLVIDTSVAVEVAIVAFSAVVGGLLRAWLGEGLSPAWWRDRPALADRVERRAPACRNLVLTATEVRQGTSVSAGIGSEIERRAATAARAIDVATLFPLRRPLAWLAAGLAATVIMMTADTTGAGSVVTGARGAPGAAGIASVTVIVTPPAHVGTPVDTLGNPGRVEVMSGSRIRIVVQSAATAVRLERVAGTMDLERSPSGYTADLVASDDDFLALTSLDSTGAVGGTRLIGLTVIPDREPVVRITAPGRDLFFSAVPETLGVVAEADDDLALASMTLRYTWVSGSGERFTFTERELPLAVRRTDGRHWTARATWRLDTLALTPGDVIVYRAEATDGRPGAAPARSDSYVLEVVTPGATAAEGFVADDDRDRYAVSQQMVILRTERLIAARRGLADSAVVDSSRVIAAEQRRVRAEFVFMMGGELEDDEALSGTLMVDEHEEAEAESDLLAGRLQNRGRIEMQRAIRAMSRAATSLTSVALDVALTEERVALDNLMRAFSRSRILLRALSQRERLDLERRLSGSLAGAFSDSRRTAEAPTQARLRTLRALLAQVAGSTDLPRDSAMRDLSSAAVQLVRIDPADDSLRSIAASLEQVANGPGGTGQRSDVEDVALRLAAHTRALLPAATEAHPTTYTAPLRGALVDELRVRGRGGR